MSGFLWVGLGGLLGSIARHAVALAMAGPAVGRFPWATFAVNGLGCLLIGVLAGAAARMPLAEPARLFLMTGVLGGFTTFSAFGLESVTLLRRGDWEVALAYAGGSVLVGLAAVWLGLRLAGAGEG